LNGLSFVKAYGLANPERFNEKFIRMKEDDINNVLEYIDDVCFSMENIDGVTYLGSSIEKDESKLLTERKSQEVSISRQSRINIKFKIESRDERLKKDNMEVLDIPIYIPKLIDGYYFTFNGNNYFPIYQLVDKSTYVIGYGDNRKLALKTLLMPIVLIQNKKEYLFENEENELAITGRMYQISLFGRSPNFLYYYFAKFGLEGTIEYFGLADSISIVNVKEGTPEYDKFQKANLVYSLSATLHIGLNYENFPETEMADDFIVSIIDLFENEKFRFSASSKSYWEKKFGAMFTKNMNNQAEKAQKLLISFERILDSRTKKVIEFPDEYKEDIYGTVFWMLSNFSKLVAKDNIDLKNKRLRLVEYIIYPLVSRFSTNTYRNFNDKSKTTFKKLKSLFRIKPGILIKGIITNELLRYDNAVNGSDLFTAGLRVSQKGPQSIISNKSEPPVKYRDIHPSYIGTVSLTHSSASEPGMNMCFTPFTETDGMEFFNDRD